MGERALAWGLRLLGIALAIGPLLIALGTHNWDIKAAVLPSDAEIKEVEDSVKGVFGGGFSENTFSIGSPTIVGNTIRISVSFTSPFNIPIKIKDISASVSNQGVEIAQVQMQEDEVEVPATATVNFTLVGAYTGGLPTNPQLSGAGITFEFYGVTILAHMSSGQGGS
jgi:hypothetical protein